MTDVRNHQGGHEMDNHGRNDHELTLTIKTTQGSWKTVFPKTVKVADVIEAVIRHFGFSPEGRYELHLSNGEVMKKERTLVSYGLKDGDCLVFTDLGAAV